MDHQQKRSGDASWNTPTSRVTGTDDSKRRNPSLFVKYPSQKLDQSGRESERDDYYSDDERETFPQYW